LGTTRESSVPNARWVWPGRIRLIAVAAFLAVVGANACCSAAAAERYPITQEQRGTAEKIAASGVALADLAPGAPASYVVKRGDTLWSIATMYLKSPWRWPELWGMNHEQIRNPHLIYPDQTLVLVKTAEGRAQLQIAGAGATPQSGAAGASGAGGAGAAAAAAAEAPPAGTETVKLSPRVRDMGAQTAAAIESIPNNMIEPYLSRPLVVAAQDMDKYPRIVATPEDRVYMGAGDTAYARGIVDNNVETYHIFRPATALYDPDDSAHRTPIAYEAMYLGTARVTKRGEVTTLTIAESSREVGVGDRLVPIGRQELVRYAPRRAPQDIHGRILSVYAGLNSVGSGDIVALNRGSKDGLEVGSVLVVLRNGRTIVDTTGSHKEEIKLPDEGIGHVFVFRLFDSISYALLVSASGPIQVGDRVAQPDAMPVMSHASFAR